MTKSIALLMVSADGAHQVNLFDGVKLPAGEYLLSVDQRDTHGLNRAELRADAGGSTHFSWCPHPYGVCMCQLAAQSR